MFTLTPIDPRRSYPIFLLPSVQQVVGGAGGEAALGPARARTKIITRKMDTHTRTHTHTHTT